MSAFADEIIPLGMTGDYINGLGFKEADWRSEGLPIIRIQNLTNSAKPFNRTLREVDDRFKVQNGDILVSWSATLDAFIWRRGAAILNQHIFKVVPDIERVEPGFLFYQLKSIIWQMSHGEHAHGSTMKHINRKPFLSHPFWCPALSQQREIASKLDRSFSGLENSEKQLQHLQSKLKQARASILKAAVEGRLVETEAELARRKGGYYEDAEELLERVRLESTENHLCQIKPRQGYALTTSGLDATTLPDVPDGWAWCRIDAIGSVQLGRQRTPKDHSGPHMCPYMRVANVFEARIDLADVKEMNFTPNEQEIYELKYGDILLNEGQSPHLVGRPAMWRCEVSGACFQNTLVRFSSSAAVLPAYALLVFRAQLHARRYMKIAKITTNIAHLGAQRFAAVEFPLAPLVEQQRIVEESERRFSILDQVEITVAASLARCGMLRQAILKRAFEGRLVQAA